mmetsp:Transcript_88326/g.248771  ORF Transcript_88326/g.248771 Transcript_88326/m.248771 type:complete len:202 (+) Transcript_88326:991-1596(+)
MILQPLLQLLVLDLDRLDLSVQLVHVCQQAEITLLEHDEDLYDLFDLVNTSALLDGRKGLLEHLDVLLMLPDVPPLDAVQEGQLKNSTVHELLGKGFLFVGDHVRPLVCIPAVASPRRTIPGARELFLLFVDLALLPNLFSEPLAISLELFPLALEQLVERALLLLRLLVTDPVLVHALLDARNGFALFLDSFLKLFEHCV